MIKINLCPIDELESQYWYVPDVAVAAVIAIVSFLGVQYYLGTIQEQIDTARSNIESLTENTQKLAPDLARFKNLQTDVASLNIKLDALKAITVSKISKYKPVIVVEHFQNLKPEGVWFESLKIGLEDSPTAFEIKGQSFDNVLTAEFMTALRSTGSQEPDDSDLRTQVYFDKLALGGAVVQEGSSAPFLDLAGYPTFTIKGNFAERGSAAAAVPVPVKGPDPRVSQANENDDEVKF